MTPDGSHLLYLEEVNGVKKLSYMRHIITLYFIVSAHGQFTLMTFLDIMYTTET